MTEFLARLLNTEDCKDWFYKHGYFPEQSVLPPCFLGPDENTPVSTSRSQILAFSSPKSHFAQRKFATIHPSNFKWILELIFSEANWKFILDHLFVDNGKIYSYTFPIPVSVWNAWKIPATRAKRQIYQFIEMSENDLVADSNKYHYVVVADVKNFYPSVYTHSIAWALHGKSAARANPALFWNKLDKAIRDSNDSCTNWIPIWPVTSDLIGEIILSAVDQSFAKQSTADCLWVRYKDDYRILCRTKEEWKMILKFLQASLDEFNLSLNEDKTSVKELPEWLFRKWTFYYPESAAFEDLDYRWFEKLFFNILELQKSYPNANISEKFLWSLVAEDHSNLRVSLRVGEETKEASKMLNLISRLLHSAPKILPAILWIAEVLYCKWWISESFLLDWLKSLPTADRTMTDYEVIWLIYFMKTNGLDFSSLWIPAESAYAKALLKWESNLFDCHWATPIDSKIRDIHGGISSIIDPFKWEFTPLPNVSAEISIADIPF